MDLINQLSEVQWNELDSFDQNELNKAQKQLHKGIQFLAIAGKFLVSQRADDSHTNASWNSDKGFFLSNVIQNRVAVALSIEQFELRVTDETGIPIYTLHLHHKSVAEVLDWLKKSLGNEFVGSEKLKLKLHYDLPFPFNDSTKFEQPELDLLHQLSLHRTNFDYIFKRIAAHFDYASAVRTWPHHFDHGVYIPFKFDENGNPLQSLSMGYAIHDTLINEPYLYLTQWAKNLGINYSDVPLLKSGLWMPDKLNGAALSLSEIIQSPNQRQIILNFLNNTLQWSLSAKVIEQ